VIRYLRSLSRLGRNTTRRPIAGKQCAKSKRPFDVEAGPAPPTPENIAAAIELYPVGERFFQEFTLRQVLLNAAKNGSGLSAAGTSGRAEGRNTAKPAATMACPAPEATPAPTDGSAPNRELP
jgi:hypothetical protein